MSDPSRNVGGGENLPTVGFFVCGGDYLADYRNPLKEGEWGFIYF